MTYKRKWNPVVGSAVSAIALLAATAALGQSLVQSTMENRVLLAFHVNEAAVQEMLPEGWMPVTLPQGPVAGSNLIASFFDRLLILDGAGNPADPASSPVLAFVTYARKEGVEGVRSFVTGVYEVPPVVDPFGNSEAAQITREAGMTYGPDGRFRSEDWSVKPESGGEFSFSLDYKVTGYNWSPGGKSMPFSPVEPDFHQIYQYDQLAELAMNATLGRELNGDVSFTADVPALSGLFDGTESLVAIVSIPVYVREVYEP